MRLADKPKIKDTSACSYGAVGWSVQTKIVNFLTMRALFITNFHHDPCQRNDYKLPNDTDTFLNH